MEFEVTLDGEELARTIQVFQDFLPENQLGAQAGLWFDGALFAIRIGSVESHIPATGRWPGLVQTTARVVLEELTCPPDQRELRLASDGQRLRIGKLTVGCILREEGRPWPRFVEQVRPFTKMELLALPFHCTEEEIEYSGLAEAVGGAALWLEGALDSMEDGLGDSALELSIDDPELAVAIMKKVIALGLERVSETLKEIRTS